MIEFHPAENFHWEMPDKGSFKGHLGVDHVVHWLGISDFVEHGWMHTTMVVSDGEKA